MNPERWTMIVNMLYAIKGCGLLVEDTRDLDKDDITQIRAWGTPDQWRTLIDKGVMDELMQARQSWNKEHDERIRLEERLKAAEARAEMWERIAKEEKSDDGQAQDPQ